MLFYWNWGGAVIVVAEDIIRAIEIIKSHHEGNIIDDSIDDSRFLECMENLDFEIKEYNLKDENKEELIFFPHACIN